MGGLNWDPGMELNVSVFDRTHPKRRKKRGNWMKQWLTIQNFEALNIASYSEDTKRCGETVGLHVGGQESHVLQQRC